MMAMMDAAAAIIIISDIHWSVPASMLLALVMVELRIEALDRSVGGRKGSCDSKLLRWDGYNCECVGGDHTNILSRGHSLGRK